VKISVIAPVKNEADYIGYSIMSVLPFVHEIIYAVAPSKDGTEELLTHIKRHQDAEKLKIFVSKEWNFKVHDMEAYNKAFNFCISKATGDFCWFLHPDMVCTNPEIIPGINTKALAFYTHVTSYAGDGLTKIVAGRGKEWKNIHAKQLGLHYYGGYGSQNEDLYHADITGKEHRHYGIAFELYPFEVADSHLRVNHYCECKSYLRRFEKMKNCLKTQNPSFDKGVLEDLAINHPRVHLKDQDGHFGSFRFKEVDEVLPQVFSMHEKEFNEVLGRSHES